ncbi:hypothetical protein M0805_002880 [Coniferiporia weirii]|nr:hypothetical protein M0805_002880 [Coniferiporia weirii]
MHALTQTLSLLLSLSALAVSPASASPRAHTRAVQHRRSQSLQQRALVEALFPSFHTYETGFTTADGIAAAGVAKVDLSDDALNVIKVQSGMTHNVVTQAGKTAWEAVYPAGSWNPSNTPLGGFGMYVGGSDAFKAAIDNGANEVVFGYSVMFEDGFEFNKGGKLPGAFGGDGSEAFGCSGGRQDARSNCFDGRFMWRAEGAGELYTYLPLTTANSVAQLAVPGTIANDDYGFSVGRGSFAFPTNTWVSILQRVKMNTPGAEDGEVRVWIDGNETITLYNVTLRDDENATIQGMQFQTFFGGSTSDWASPKDQKAWFADVSGAVVQS